MAKKENTDRWFICISRLWVVAFVAFPLLWSACSGPKNEVVKGFEDAAEVPTLRTLDVMTLISDSGVTRYRINADRKSTRLNSSHKVQSRMPSSA